MSTPHHLIAHSLDWRGVVYIGPRFALVSLQYLLTRTPTSSLPPIVFITGLVRTLSCGGWVYITSSDDHDIHDVLMISYIVCNIPWMLGGIACTPVENTPSRRRRWGRTFRSWRMLAHYAKFIIRIMFASACVHRAHSLFDAGSLANANNLDSSFQSYPWYSSSSGTRCTVFLEVTRLCKPF